MYAIAIPALKGEFDYIVEKKLKNFQKAISYKLDSRQQQLKAEYRLTAFVVTSAVVACVITLLALNVYGLASLGPTTLMLTSFVVLFFFERARRRVSGQGTASTIWQLHRAIYLCKRELRFCEQEAIRTRAGNPQATPETT